jgi:UDP-arabinose 4-epimerase
VLESDSAASEAEAMSRNILVTGGAGYIGSHTCKALARAGYMPVVYDNLVYGHEWAVKWGPFERGDILDSARLDEVIRRYAPAAVIHFAAFAYVGESVAEPLKYYRNNVAGSLALLEAMRAHKIGAMVFSSTCAIYGIPQSSPIAENAAQAPVNPYGHTKLAVEWVLADCAAAKDLSYVALRYFNAAGADRDGEIGEDHAPETHLIPLAIQAALDSREPLSLYGLDYETKDGSAVRDYVHVEDLARAHVAALDYLLAGGKPVALNVGTGKGVSVLDVIAAIERHTARKVPWKSAPRRPGDPPTLVANSAQLKAVLNIDPESFASLDVIVETAWRWHLKQHNIAKD